MFKKIGVEEPETGRKRRFSASAGLLFQKIGKFFLTTGAAVYYNMDCLSVKNRKNVKLI